MTALMSSRQADPMHPDIVPHSAQSSRDASRCIERLVVRLREESLWHGGREVTTADRSMPVRFLVGGAGWLTAWLLLVLLLFFLDDVFRRQPLVVAGIGVALCGLGVSIRRMGQGAFAHQAGMAAVLAGVGLCMWFVNDERPHAWWVVLPLVALCYAAAGGWLYRLVLSLAAACTIWFALGAMVHASASASISALTMNVLAFAAWVMVVPTVTPALMHWRVHTAPAVLGLALASSVLAWEAGVAMTPAEMWAAIQGGNVGRIVNGMHALLPALTWLCVAYRKAHPASSGGWRDHGTRGLVPGALLMLFALVPFWLLAPGVGLSVVWAMAGFASLQAGLLAVGVVGLVAYLARFYYLLDFTLLVKSASLVLVGALLVAFAMLLRLQQSSSPIFADEDE